MSFFHALKVQNSFKTWSPTIYSIVSGNVSDTETQLNNELKYSQKSTKQCLSMAASNIANTKPL